MTTEMGSRLSSKVAVVTGAGATGSGDFVGVGQAISMLFARQGARVLLVDREERNAEATLAMIREEGGEASVFVGDVTSNEDMREMAEAAQVPLRQRERAGQQRRHQWAGICNGRRRGFLGHGAGRQSQERDAVQQAHDPANDRGGRGDPS